MTRAAALSRRAATVFGLAWLLSPGTVVAHSYRHGPLSIGHAWARPATGDTGEAFLPIGISTGRDRLIGAATPLAASVAFRDGERTTDGFDIAQGASLAMRPGRRHLRLVGLTKALTVGDRFALTLTFQTAPPLTIEVWVETAPYAR
ncbi:MAG: copper chaperone PCu(A)C [Alphaproteobacteria bacterium]|nr:copper chaperone PCu(A)C [Alphaproteobacteria bacterium]